MGHYSRKFWGFTDNETEPPYLLKETAVTFETEIMCMDDARKHLRGIHFPYTVVLSIVNDPRARHPVYKTFSMRLSSFHNWPPAIPIRGIELARAGFFYTGLHDQVTCYSCGKTVCKWNVNDTPLEVHEKVSPECIYLTSLDANYTVPRTANTSRYECD